MPAEHPHAYVAGSLVIHLAFVTMLRMIPAEASTIPVELESIELTPILSTREQVIEDANAQTFAPTIPVSVAPPPRKRAFACIGCGNDPRGESFICQGTAHPPVSLATPSVVGDGLAKHVIKRFVKRNVARISSCYEAERLAKPNLAGAVTMHFEITANGDVSSAIGTGMDGNVARCVADIIKTINFPKPRSGSVQVKYPFSFGK